MRRRQLATAHLISHVKDIWEQEIFVPTIYIFYSTKLVLDVLLVAGKIL